MIIIGEKINATRKPIAAAISAKDEEHIITTAKDQVAAGADYIDLNGGDPNPETEAANMEWLVKLVQDNVDVPLCLDSSNIKAIERGLALVKSKPIVNSITLETERLESFLPVLAEHECMVIGLCLSDDGMPRGVDDRLDRAARLIDQLTGIGKKIDEIIIDPAFLPVSAEPDSGKAVCQAIAKIREKFPEVHIGGGLSNVSFGLPKRKFINLAMVSMAISNGMDTAIVDPCTPYMVPIILAAEAICGADQWCANYISAYRDGRLG